MNLEEQLNSLFNELSGMGIYISTSEQLPVKERFFLDGWLNNLRNSVVKIKSHLGFVNTEHNNPFEGEQKESVRIFENLREYLNGDLLKGLRELDAYTEFLSLSPRQAHGLKTRIESLKDDLEQALREAS